MHIYTLYNNCIKWIQYNVRLLHATLLKFQNDNMTVTIALKGRQTNVNINVNLTNK